MIYLLTAIGLSRGGSSTVHIYTQTIHRTIQNKQYIEQHNNLGECGSCPIFASYTLAFALQPRKEHGKTSVRVKKTAVRVYMRIEAMCLLKINLVLKRKFKLFRDHKFVTKIAIYVSMSYFDEVLLKHYSLNNTKIPTVYTYLLPAATTL